MLASQQTKHRFKVVCWYELAVLIAFFGLSLLQLIDEQGVNRTPKPLVAIVTSAVLRQARGIVTEESVAGSDAGDALFGGDGLSGAGFSRGWFDSGTATPQEVDPQDYQGEQQQVAWQHGAQVLISSVLCGCTVTVLLLR